MRTIPALPQGDPWTQLRDLTTARIALGRAGHSLPTRELLAFQLAHAKARDAVWCALDASFIDGQLLKGALRLHSAARDRAEYLRRPDLGRRLSSASAEQIARGNWDVVIIIADGLSATAVHHHASIVVEHLLKILQTIDHPSLAAAFNALHPVAPQGRPQHRAGKILERQSTWRIAPICVVEQGRVAIGDEIGERIGAAMSLVLLGERPGLSSPDSLGAYLTWSPRIGRTDAERNCISNIRAAGLDPEIAAVRIAQLMQAARQQRLTGIHFASPEAAGRVLTDR